MFDFLDCFGYFNVLWVGFGVVECGVVVLYFVDFVEDVEVFGGGFVVVVEDEVVCVDDCCWVEVVVFVLEYWVVGGVVCV